MTAKDEKRPETAAVSAPEPAGKRLAPAAERALAEAAERRAALEHDAKAKPKELHGRDGPDPARYGDWEHKGIASDF